MSKFKSKPKCEVCRHFLVFCGECDAPGIVLSWQEAQDCISGLHKIIADYEKRQRHPSDKKVVAQWRRLAKKLWKLKGT